MPEGGSFPCFGVIFVSRANVAFKPRFSAGGGGYYHPFAPIMSESGNYFVCSITAARTGLIRTPSRFPAGSRLSCVIDYIVPKSGGRTVSTGEFRPANRAVNYRIVPTRICTGCLHAVFRYACACGVPRSGYFRICSIVAARAGSVSVPALFGAGGRLSCVIDYIVPERGGRTVSAGEFNPANRAINYRIVPARSGTGYRHVVFRYACACGVPRGGYFRICSIVAARAGFVSVPAYLGTTRRFCHVVNNIVPEGGFYHLPAERAYYGFCASGFQSIGGNVLRGFYFYVFAGNYSEITPI